MGELLLPPHRSLQAHRGGWEKPGPAVEKAVGTSQVSPAHGPRKHCRDLEAVGGFLSSVTSCIWIRRQSNQRETLSMLLIEGVNDMSILREIFAETQRTLSELVALSRGSEP